MTSEKWDARGRPRVPRNKSYRSPKAEAEGALSEETGWTMQNYRKMAGMSQAEMSAALGEGQSVVSKWERGDSRITVFNLLRYLEQCGATRVVFTMDGQLWAQPLEHEAYIERRHA